MDLRHFLTFDRSLALLLDEQMNLLNSLILYLMAFMTLKLIVFEKKCYLILFSLSFYLLPILFNEKADTTIMLFTEGSIKHILRGQIWF